LQRKVQTGKKRSQKTKERIKKNMVGFKGKSHSDESRKKISTSLKGKNLGREHKRKISDGCSKGNVYCFFEGELKYKFNSGADGVRKFLELGLIKSDSTFGKALRHDGQVEKGKLKGWEIVRIDKNTVLPHNKYQSDEAI
ncbi:MAG TPA: NUMOD3 domain-containing DNA-binding protein, partial [Bacillales bacterium]|nr:NUMOD3 domain-containing DNA-binding protein [Bacillales bacterium]